MQFFHILIILAAFATSDPLKAKLEAPEKDETQLKTTEKPSETHKSRPLIKRLKYQPTAEGLKKQFQKLLRRKKLIEQRKKAEHAKKLESQWNDTFANYPCNEINEFLKSSLFGLLSIKIKVPYPSR